MVLHRRFITSCSSVTLILCVVNWKFSFHPPLSVHTLINNDNIALLHFINKQHSERYHKDPFPRPPLESIVQGWNITGDPSWLLNYAIIGFPKCGTSSLMFHLQSHPEISIFPNERCELSCNQHARLIDDLYTNFTTRDQIRAIKCPADLENTQLALRNYKKFFHKTDFIVGIRHPVLWFESFYNFRVHNGQKMPPAQNLIGNCYKGFNGVCTFRGNFHIFLSNLGKTNISDPQELQYVDLRFQKHIDPVPTNRKVFLYEVSQLSDPNINRENQIRQDLQTFLHLREPISPVIWFKPGKNHTDEQHICRIEEKKINICDDLYNDLRKVLMSQAINASTWIRDYFLSSEDVVVSSKEYFSDVLLKSWEVDPCILRNRRDNNELVGAS